MKRKKSKNFVLERSSDRIWRRERVEEMDKIFNQVTANANGKFCLLFFLSSRPNREIQFSQFVVRIRQAVYLFRWFLWLNSQHQPTKIITICNIGWLGISKKIRRRRCLAINAHDRSQLFSFSFSDKLIGT